MAIDSISDNLLQVTIFSYQIPTEVTVYGKKKIVDLGSKLFKIRGWDKLEEYCNYTQQDGK
jgi:hypothetical protein